MFLGFFLCSFIVIVELWNLQLTKLKICVRGGRKIRVIIPMSNRNYLFIISKSKKINLCYLIIVKNDFCINSLSPLSFFMTDLTYSFEPNEYKIIFNKFHNFQFTLQIMLRQSYQQLLL